MFVLAGLIDAAFLIELWLLRCCLPLPALSRSDSFPIAVLFRYFG